ncbi:MAG: hypothetical protein IT351_06545, partial [Candidatus Fermentibacter sp.]|nr:hypothetical protein [Candidatus Fermentibacter sp.]
MRYLVILIVSALFLQASAGILPFSVTADVTWNSKYVWRGLPCDEESVLQPSLFLSLTGLTAGVWGNVEMTDVNELTEE